MTGTVQIDGNIFDRNRGKGQWTELRAVDKIRGQLAGTIDKNRELLTWTGDSGQGQLTGDGDSLQRTGGS